MLQSVEPDGRLALPAPAIVVDEAALGPPPKASLRLSLLDGFQLEADGSAVEVPLSAQRLVAFLAVHERPLLRTFIAGSLWLDNSEERAHANLRAALWRLRQAAARLVESRGAHLRLAPEVEVDFQRAMLVARVQIQSTFPTPEVDANLRLLLSGELLPDWYEEWIGVERERLRQLRLHALEALCERFAAAGRFGEAVDVGLAAVAVEPLRESAHRALISAHLAEGNTFEAARQFDSYRRLLWDALAAEPSPQLEEMVARRLDSDTQLGKRYRRDAMVTVP
jgi:DNA-binding SARP family transcriptional activator